MNNNTPTPILRLGPGHDIVMPVGTDMLIICTVEGNSITPRLIREPNKIGVKNLMHFMKNHECNELSIIPFNSVYLIKLTKEDINHGYPEIKPCPFCGNQSLKSWDGGEDEGGDSWIECTPCEFVFTHTLPLDRVIALWNKRA